MCILHLQIMSLCTDNVLMHCTYCQVPAQKGLQEATLATVACPQDVTPEHIALGLLLLQVNVLVPGDYATQHGLTYTYTIHTSSLSYTKTNTLSLLLVMAAACESCS